ncbi:hypothetical protein MTR67_005015 [Solanum verrucosum]|uniref:DNA-directed RNA polymerase n=1 Tax=Solanum verrucosum TaxID=315347 RepID=A0AAF0PX98_SOLVR|nr:hypothetical protein MTR67_005015 [Solanum verrucosum]
MEESLSSKVSDGIVKRIKFGLATPQEICKSSISDCPITHPSLLLNPFLGLPLEAGRCESCGTAEPGQCEGHFGYIELPIPIYHPDHVSELKKMLSLLCLKCLKMKNRKFQVKNAGVLERMLSSCCEQAIILDAKISHAKATLFSAQSECLPFHQVVAFLLFVPLPNEGSSHSVDFLHNALGYWK